MHDYNQIKALGDSEVIDSLYHLILALFRVFIEERETQMLSEAKLATQLVAGS